MGTYLIMLALVICLGVVMLPGIQAKSDTAHFFDLTNTKALRGFWAIIVVLVHVPEAYQNPIQDALGSFAYIGVTFFFVTSAYGLWLGRNKMGRGLAFWRRRLPKLLIPCFFANGVEMAVGLIAGQSYALWYLLTICDWLKWLLVCYVLFWTLEHISALQGKARMAILCILVAAFSLSIYVLDDYIEQTTWCTEVYGFIWGILLAANRERFVRWAEKNWGVKTALFMAASAVLGGLYLKAKWVPFFGDYLLKILLGVAILTFLLLLNIRFSLGNRANQYLGSISYEIYLLHNVAFALLMCGLPGLSSGAFVAGAVAVTILLSALIKRPADSVCKITEGWLMQGVKSKET